MSSQSSIESARDGIESDSVELGRKRQRVVDGDGESFVSEEVECGVGRPQTLPNGSRRSRKYCWVLNNYSVEDEGVIKGLFERESGGISYLVFQREVGSNGTPHLQGFVYFQSARSFEAVRRFFSNAFGHQRLHIEIAKGSPDQNRAYCTKHDSRVDGPDSGPFEFGERPAGQGKRTDLQVACDVIRTGGSWVEVALSNTDVFVKYSTGVLRASAVFAKPRATKPLVKWYYGRTGKGKSRFASEESEKWYCDHFGEISGVQGIDDVNHPMRRAYWKNGSSSWWDGYCGQLVVIIDDYRKDMCKFSELLRLLDYYPYQVEVKGAFVNFTAKLVIFTTPKSPVETWEGRTEEDLDQLCRRIDVVTHFDSL